MTASDPAPILYTSQTWRGFLSLDTIPREAGVRRDSLAALALDEIPKGVMRRLAYQQFKRSYPEITDYGPDGSA